MDDEQKLVPASDIPTIRSEQFRSVYVNHARGGLTNWDLRFTFSSLAENPPNQPVVEDQIMLMMTCEFAKALIGTIAITIGAYEKRKMDDANTPIVQTTDAEPKKD